MDSLLEHAYAHDSVHNELNINQLTMSKLKASRTFEPTIANGRPLLRKVRGVLLYKDDGLSTELDTTMRPLPLSPQYAFVGVDITLSKSGKISVHKMRNGEGWEAGVSVI